MRQVKRETKLPSISKAYTSWDSSLFEAPPFISLNDDLWHHYKWFISSYFQCLPREKWKHIFVLETGWTKWQASGDHVGEPFAVFPAKIEVAWSPIGTPPLSLSFSPIISTWSSSIGELLGTHIIELYLYLKCVKTAIFCYIISIFK